MGLEIGWYTRFYSVADRFEALIDKRNLKQVQHHVGPDCGWNFEVVEEDDHLRLVFQRKARTPS